MYVFGGAGALGVVWSRDEAKLRDQLQYIKDTHAAYWGTPIPAQAVKDLQEMLNAQLARHGYRIEVDGRLSWPVCAALDYLYGARSTYVASDSILGTLKRLAGCPWSSGGGGTLAFEPYPQGRKDRDFLTPLSSEPSSSVVNVLTTQSTTVPYCRPRSLMCFDGQGEKDTAQTQCQYGYKPKRGTDPCIIQQRFDYSNQHQYDPCEIQDFPVCDQSAVQVRQELQAESAQPIAPVPAPVEEEAPPEVTEEDAENAAPIGGEGVLQFSHLYWGQGPDAEVTALIHEYLNPKLRKMGYRQIGENQRFNMQVCAALKRTYPSEFSAFTGCGHQPIPNPEQFLSRPTPTGQQSTQSSGEGTNPAPVFYSAESASVETIYDDEPVDTIYGETIYSGDFEPSAEEDLEIEETEERSMAVYGILAAVVIGGGAVYLMTRKKKKRR